MTISADMLQHHKVEFGLGSWCADKAIPDGVTCADGLLGTNDWPDKAVVCIDRFQSSRCVRLGDLRAWVERYYTRELARHIR